MMMRPLTYRLRGSHLDAGRTEASMMVAAGEGNKIAPNAMMSTPVRL
jgi:hypothetical protein